MTDKTPQTINDEKRIEKINKAISGIKKNPKEMLEITIIANCYAEEQEVAFRKGFKLGYKMGKEQIKNQGDEK